MGSHVGNNETQPTTELPASPPPHGQFGPVPTSPPPAYRPGTVPTAAHLNPQPPPAGGGGGTVPGTPSSGTGGIGNVPGYGFAPPGGSPPISAAAAATVTSTIPAGPSGPTRPTEKGRGSWGWRALVAFIAGGLLTATGFGVAQLSRDSGETGDIATETGEAAPATTGRPEDTAGTTSDEATTTAPRPSIGGSEPAVAVADVLGRSVVQIETNFGVGSGVVYGDGLILTNAHVIAGAQELTVHLHDGRRLPAEIIGAEAVNDIGVVSVGEGQDLQIAELAVGETVQVGQTAIAIGSPFSLQRTVTEGIVSAVNRPVPNQVPGAWTAMIQTDAPINPGNSGGALADVDGRVIGINTAIQTGGTDITNAGVGFAIPIDTAVQVADRLVEGIPIEGAFLGVGGDFPTDGSAGVEVTDVSVGSGAEAAGLQVGDRILSIDGAPVSQFQELAGLVMSNAPGDAVELEIIRNGEPQVLTATLGARTDDPDN